jgi:hypothetical protein
VNIRVLAGTDINAGAVAVLQHDAVSADVDPVGIGIFGYDEMTGAEISAAVLFMQQGRGKIEQIDLLAFLHIFLCRADFYFHSRQR